MSPQPHSTDGIRLLYKAITLICQTLFYGIYAALIPFSTHFLIKKRAKTRANIVMFFMTIFMFMLSTSFWAASVANLVVTINTKFIYLDPNQPSIVVTIFPLFNAILLINYVLTDSVVVWRAWVLCRDGSKKMLMIPLSFLVFTSLSVLATVAIRISMTASGDKPRLDSIINISQMMNLVLSLLTNISATSIIALRAWQHRRSIQITLSRARDTSTKVERILILLVESGLIYCISGIVVLVASVIHLPQAVGTVGDIYTPVHVQVAGIYPTVILVLVSQERSLKEGAFSTAGNVTGMTSTPISINFTSNPALTVSTIFYEEMSQNDSEENDSEENIASEAQPDFKTRMGKRLEHEQSD